VLKRLPPVCLNGESIIVVSLPRPALGNTKKIWLGFMLAVGASAIRESKLGGLLSGHFNADRLLARHILILKFFIATRAAEATEFYGAAR
jgi:hypothetical protein